MNGHEIPQLLPPSIGELGAGIRASLQAHCGGHGNISSSTEAGLRGFLDQSR